MIGDGYWLILRWPSLAWCAAASTACDLLARTRLLALNGDIAKAEPKTLRYRLLHTAARIVRGQRRRYLRIPDTWPWATQGTRRHVEPAPTDTTAGHDPTTHTTKQDQHASPGQRTGPMITSANHRG